MRCRKLLSPSSSPSSTGYRIKTNSYVCVARGIELQFYLLCETRLLPKRNLQIFKRILVCTMAKNALLVIAAAAAACGIPETVFAREPWECPHFEELASPFMRHSFDVKAYRGTWYEASSRNIYNYSKAVPSCECAKYDFVLKECNESSKICQFSNDYTCISPKPQTLDAPGNFSLDRAGVLNESFIPKLPLPRLIVAVWPQASTEKYDYALEYQCSLFGDYIYFLSRNMGTIPKAQMDEMIAFANEKKLNMNDIEPSRCPV